MARVILSAIAALMVLSVSASAEPFWISWEGDTYPEQDGWTRYTRAGGAERILQDGALTLDSMADWRIVDEYYIDRALSLAPGESFRMDWRVRVNDVLGDFDPAVILHAGGAEVILNYSTTSIYSTLECAWVAEFAPGVYHDYSLTTSDFSAYALSIDGHASYTGRLVGPLPGTFVGWGDCTEGPSSVSAWEYFRFGIVPEPSAGLIFGLAGLAANCILSPRSWRQQNDEVE
jgi:hypothetical protein